MKLQRLEVYYIAFSMTYILCFATNSTGMLDFPFSKITLDDNDFNVSILMFTCRHTFSNLKECAEQCYYREKDRVGCVAFLKFKSTKECTICNPATISEIISSKNTQINENHVVYILKYKKKKPVMYLPLEGDNITGSTVIGDGVTGTLRHQQYIQVQAGKVNEGLHVRNGGRLVLDGTANACINYLEKCTNGLSIALWFNPSDLRHRHITHGERSINILLSRNHLIETWAWGKTKEITSIKSQSRVFANTWTNIIVVYDPEAGLSLYVNGTLEAFRSISESRPHTRNRQHNYVFGSKANGGFSFDGTLDEIKVFYESLTDTCRFKTGTYYIKHEILAQLFLTFQFLSKTPCRNF